MEWQNNFIPLIKNDLTIDYFIDTNCINALQILASNTKNPLEHPDQQISIKRLIYTSVFLIVLDWSGCLLYLVGAIAKNLDVKYTGAGAIGSHAILVVNVMNYLCFVSLPPPEAKYPMLIDSIHPRQETLKTTVLIRSSVVSN